MDDEKMTRVGMARAGTNTRAKMTMRTTRERGKGDDLGTGMSIT